MEGGARTIILRSLHLLLLLAFRCSQTEQTQQHGHSVAIFRTELSHDTHENSPGFPGNDNPDSSVRSHLRHLDATRKLVHWNDAPPLKSARVLSTASTFQATRDSAEAPRGQERGPVSARQATR